MGKASAQYVRGLEFESGKKSENFSMANLSVLSAKLSPGFSGGEVDA